MILPKPADALHKMWLYRLLSSILDNPISHFLSFKGGTCAAMLNWLDRFSLDLDFDLNPKADKKIIRQELMVIFKDYGLTVKNPNNKTLQFILQYPSQKTNRNSLKLGIVDNLVRTNDYGSFYLSDIDRYCVCQTKETMVANKLVALIDRFDKYHAIAGRDLYDIHYFLANGFSFKKEIIEERTKMKTNQYLLKLIEFIKDRINEEIISEDLNYLLPYQQFKTIRKTLKTETLILLKDLTVS